MTAAAESLYQRWRQPGTWTVIPGLRGFRSTIMRGRAPACPRGADAARRAAARIADRYGGVDAFAAPWYGSMAGHVPAGQSVTGIAGE